MCQCSYVLLVTHIYGSPDYPRVLLLYWIYLLVRHWQQNKKKEKKCYTDRFRTSKLLTQNSPIVMPLYVFHLWDKQQPKNNQITNQKMFNKQQNRFGMELNEKDTCALTHRCSFAVSLSGGDKKSINLIKKNWLTREHKSSLSNTIKKRFTILKQLTNTTRNWYWISRTFLLSQQIQFVTGDNFIF